MRIEKVVIQNINSLAGRFEIDFTDNKYSEGLFAITGPSGAGKTTVLDAVCLALYGKTPRIDTISETQDEIMNKYSGSCEAQTVFISRGKRYRAVFSHARSGGAKPFRQVKREVFEYTPDGTEAIIASSIREAAEKIPEITGLTYSQFTRSIMLAQFQFAEFLKSDANERAAILEQISDMDIYREISAAVYERAKTEKSKLDEIKAQMQVLRVLDEGEKAALERERLRLAEMIEKHGALRTAFSGCVDGAKKTDMLRAELGAYEAAAPALDKKRSEAVKELEQARENEAAAKKALDELRGTLTKVRELDGRTEAVKADISRLNDEAVKDADKIKEHKREILKLFLKYLPDAGNDKLKQLYEAADAAESLRAGAKAELESEETKRGAIAGELKTALSGRDEAYWQSRADAYRILVPLAEAREAAAEAGKRLSECTERIKELAEQEKALAIQDAVAGDRLVYARLDERFGQERQRLEDGKPCPLCGAEQHPYAGRPHDYTYLAEAQAKKDEAAGKLQSAREALVAAKQEALALDEVIKDRTGVAADKESELIKHGLSVEVTDAEQAKKALTEAEGVIRGVAALQSKLSAAKDDIIKLTAKFGEADRDAAVIQEHKNAISVLERGAAERDKLRAETEKRLSALSGERIALFGSKDADTEEEAADKHVKEAESLKERRRGESEHFTRDYEQNKKDISRTAEQLKAEEALLAKAYAAARESALSAAKEQPFENEDIAAAFGELKGEAEGLAEAVPEERALARMAALTADLISRETARLGAVGQRLSDNESSMREMAGLKNEEKKQSLYCAKWDRLSALIGSADGVKFSRMAQGYTFDALIAFANSCLLRMSDRYVLARDTSTGAKPLELIVADNYQGGEKRPVVNLSGGESFIVSMALALGMSEMSSGKTRIDSLFIDEGFASLDEDYLEAALQTLSALGNREGKLVGVISHVGALKERIDAQIEVKKLSGGRSTLMGPGVTAIGEQ